MILVGIGTYSVLAYTVSQQTHDFVIRMAQGALEQNVFLMVLRIGGVLVGMGLAIGFVASLFFESIDRQSIVGRGTT